MTNKLTNIGLDFFVEYNSENSKLKIKIDSFPISFLSKPMRNNKIESKEIEVYIEGSSVQKEENILKKIESELNQYMIGDKKPTVYVPRNSTEESYLRKIGYDQSKIEYAGANVLYKNKKSPELSTKPIDADKLYHGEKEVKKNVYYDVDFYFDPLLKTFYYSSKTYGTIGAYRKGVDPLVKFEKVIHKTDADAMNELFHVLKPQIKNAVKKGLNPIISLPFKNIKLKSYLISKFKEEGIKIKFEEKIQPITQRNKNAALEIIKSEMNKKYDEMAKKGKVILSTDGTAFDKEIVKFRLNKSFVGGAYIIESINDDGIVERISSNRFMAMESNVELSNVGEFIALTDGLNRIIDAGMENNEISIILDSDLVFSCLEQIKNKNYNFPIEYKAYADELMLLINKNNIQFEAVVMKSHQNQQNHSFNEIHKLTEMNMMVDKLTRNGVQEFISEINSKSHAQESRADTFGKKFAMFRK